MTYIVRARGTSFYLCLNRLDWGWTASKGKAQHFEGDVKTVRRRLENTLSGDFDVVPLKTPKVEK